MFKDNTDYPHSDIVYVDGLTLSTCKATCAKTNTCDRVVWKKSGAVHKRCYLKTSGATTGNTDGDSQAAIMKNNRKFLSHCKSGPKNGLRYVPLD